MKQREAVLLEREKQLLYREVNLAMKQQQQQPVSVTPTPKKRSSKFLKLKAKKESSSSSSNMISAPSGKSEAYFL